MVGQKKKCNVCGNSIGLLGWPNHVKKEKKLYGENVYKVISSRIRMEEYIKKKLCITCGKPMVEVYDWIAKKFTGHLWTCNKCMKGKVLSIG